MKDIQIDAMIKENEQLAYELFESRRIAFGLLMAFIHMSSDQSDAPVSWLLAYLVNNDKSILDYEEASEWPPGYLEETEEFCKLIAFYIDNDGYFPPVIQSAQIMKFWPYNSAPKNILH